MGKGAWANGSTPEWRRIRRMVLERDGYTCKLNLPGCTHLATICHHTIGRAITGDDPRYLQAACRPCNTKAGNPGEKTNPPPKTSTKW